MQHKYGLTFLLYFDSIKLWFSFFIETTFCPLTFADLEVYKSFRYSQMQFETWFDRCYPIPRWSIKFWFSIFYWHVSAKCNLKTWFGSYLPIVHFVSLTFADLEVYKSFCYSRMQFENLIWQIPTHPSLKHQIMI